MTDETRPGSYILGNAYSIFPLRALYSVGLVFKTDGATPQFLGTCFPFRTADHFLTAAHCVGNLRPEQIGITLPMIEHGGFCGIRKMTRHPTADLALLHTEPIKSPDGYFVFAALGDDPTWGDEVRAVGYPEDSDEEGMVPTARYFSGHIQRLYSHKSQLGYVYGAGELSFGAPGGLSGGPVFRPSEPHLVIGVVTENRDSTTYLRSVAEIQEEGSVYREHVHELIRYGVFLRLRDLWKWLDYEIFGVTNEMFA